MARTKVIQADVRRAVKGALQGGLRVAKVEIDEQGRIAVVSEKAASELSDNQSEDVSKLL